MSIPESLLASVTVNEASEISHVHALSGLRFHERKEQGLFHESTSL